MIVSSVEGERRQMSSAAWVLHEPEGSERPDMALQLQSGEVITPQAWIERGFRVVMGGSVEWQYFRSFSSIAESLVSMEEKTLCLDDGLRIAREMGQHMTPRILAYACAHNLLAHAEKNERGEWVFGRLALVRYLHSLKR